VDDQDCKCGITHSRSGLISFREMQKATEGNCDSDDRDSISLPRMEATGLAEIDEVSESGISASMRYGSIREQNLATDIETTTAASSVAQLTPFENDKKQSIVAASAITRSAAAYPSTLENLPRMSIRASNRIHEHILKPLMAKQSLKDFHPIVRDCPRRIYEKEIVCLRDLEKTLFFMALVSDRYIDDVVRGLLTGSRPALRRDPRQPNCISTFASHLSGAFKLQSDFFMSESRQDQMIAHTLAATSLKLSTRSRITHKKYKLAKRRKREESHWVRWTLNRMLPLANSSILWSFVIFL
jgi:hypothetical protein